jgi:hypothetical protein
MVLPLAHLAFTIPAKGMSDELLSARCLILQSLRAHCGSAAASEPCLIPGAARTMDLFNEDCKGWGGRQ